MVLSTRRRVGASHFQQVGSSPADVNIGPLHTPTVAAANVADVTEVPSLLRGKEHRMRTRSGQTARVFGRVYERAACAAIGQTIPRL